LLIKRGLLLLSFSIPSQCPFSSNILFKYNLNNEIHYLFTGPVYSCLWSIIRSFNCVGYRHWEGQILWSFRKSAK